MRIIIQIKRYLKSAENFIDVVWITSGSEIIFTEGDLEIMKLSIIIPAYNEEKTIFELLRRVLSIDLSQLKVEREIIVINDNSEDGTYEIVRKNFPEVVLINNDGCRGKGSALRKGINSSSGDIIIFQDADLEYDPQDYIKLINPIIQGRAAVVYGSRYLSTNWLKGMYIINHIGNKLGTLLCNILYNAHLTDLMTCYKAFQKDALMSISLSRNGFDICPEITAKIKKRGLTILEVPVSYQGRKYKYGKKISFFDAFFILSALLEYKIKD